MHFVCIFCGSRHFNFRASSDIETLAIHVLSVWGLLLISKKRQTHHWIGNFISQTTVECMVLSLLLFIYFSSGPVIQRMRKTARFFYPEFLRRRLQVNERAAARSKHWMIRHAECGAVIGRLASAGRNRKRKLKGRNKLSDRNKKWKYHN